MAQRFDAHGKQERVRPARVRMKYEVSTDGAIKNVELPFVAGVIGDFSGQPAQPLPDIRERQFVELRKGTFDDVLKGMKPRLAFAVDNLLTRDGTKLEVELEFRRMADFEPAQIVSQVGPLRDLLALREKLRDLRSKAAGRARLEDLLNQVLQESGKAGSAGEAPDTADNPPA